MSSRAIPVKKMIDQVRNSPAMPVFWGKNQAGMQAKEELTGNDLEKAKEIWLKAAEDACRHAEALVEIGLHKQIANRILEPWQWMHTIVTATEWDNFWALRCHPDAQPEFHCLATLMRDGRNELVDKVRAAYKTHVPKPIKFGEWHLPYVRPEERNAFKIADQVKLSTARCARVSFLNHDGTTPDPLKDIDLHDKLIVQKPIHASPAEHSATPYRLNKFQFNLKGWRNYRYHIEKGLKV
jgi:hypothetical protein